MIASASTLLLCSPPIPRTRLIGRQTEQRTAHALLLDEAVPLLTLTGPGGVGKTRLALAIPGQVTAAFGDGVVWVDLAPLSDPALVPMTVARALGIAPTPGAPVVEEIATSLRPRQLLLVLDNCEHVLVETAALVSALLAVCPALQILATSRAPLRVQGEHEHPVDPLPLPDANDLRDAGTLQHNDAVRLFVDRAHAIDPALSVGAETLLDVADICRRLDGVPLAIELAAARIRMFSPAAMRADVERMLPLLTGGPRDTPARQRTMRDTIAWSYDLLTPQDQEFFARLSVFTGGFTVDGAQAVTDGTSGEDVLAILDRLLEHHLIRRAASSGPPRFTILETIREFGLEQLTERGDEEATRDRHATYFLDLVERLNAAVAEHVPEERQVLARLEAEHPNLRAALGWLEATGAAEPFVQLAGTLHGYWLHFGYPEGRAWLERAVAQGAAVPARLRVWAQVGLAAMLADQKVEPERALALIEEAVVLARESEDPLCLALATEHRVIIAVGRGEYDQAEAWTRKCRAAFTALPDAPWVARNLTHVDTIFGWIAVARGDLATAETRCAIVLERQRMLEREHRASYPYTGFSLTILGCAARGRGDNRLALARYQEALRDHASNVYGLAQALGGVAGSLAALGRWIEAARLFGATEALCERTGLSFHGHVFDWQRALGLPEPWQRADASFGAAASLGAAVAQRSSAPVPPLPDPEAAAACWAMGRALPREDAVAEALAVDLALPPPRLATSPEPLPHADPFGLSPREREVLALLGQRLTDAEIGEQLFISPRTASRHVANLFDKIGVSSRREAAARAVHLGLI